MFVKFLILLTVAALVVGYGARSTHGAGPQRSYVVKPTDTLWSIAERTYAGDTREGVWKLEQRNHLSSAVLVPGQRLLLPSS